MIQTVDFFTPIVDDPYMFGQIAAANSLSDIYAMGGRPVVALNIVAFPNCLDVSILGDILKGGADKVMESGAVLAGGHSIQDNEPKYGLCVSGIVHPDKLYQNIGAKPGDVLILTKPIGSGVVNTAVKGELASKDAIHEASLCMSSLNKTAAEAAALHTVHACTDVTGFGLIGHACEMTAGEVTFEIDVHKIPYLCEADEYAMMGLVPGGAYRNRAYRGDQADVSRVEEHFADLAFDPQTSGGLLLAVPEEEADPLMADLRLLGLATPAAIIGRVLPRQEKEIILI